MSSSDSVRLRYEKCLEVWGNASFVELKVECGVGAKGPHGCHAGPACVGHGKVVDGLVCHVDGMVFFAGFYANSDAARFPSFTGTQKLGKFDVCASGAGLAQRM